MPIDDSALPSRPPLHDASVAPWPPRTRGPLPADLPPDLNIATAHDEIDAWAVEHDRQTERLARLRRNLTGTATEEGVEVRYLRERSVARRLARANPTERGRRTQSDIDAEVDERLVDSGVAHERLRLHSEIEVATSMLFRAKENIARLTAYVRSLPVDGGGAAR